MEQGWLGKATAEFVGTFALVFFGAGSIVMNEFLGADGYGLVGIAAVHAIVLALMVSATMNISGGHINPAVSIAAFLNRKLSAPLMGIYIGAQLLGGILAAAFVTALLPSAAAEATTLGATLVNAEALGAAAGMPLWLKAIAVETVLTFFLVFVIWGTGVSRHAPPVGGFAIGLVLFFDIMVGGPLTGASMNPARTLGPALVAGEWAMHLVYWIGPILGAALASLVYEAVVDPAAEPEVEPQTVESRE